MKKTLIMLAVFTVAAVLANAQENAEFKPSGKVFGLLYADYHSTFSGGENVHIFQVTRSYLGYDYSFSKTLLSRVLFDGFIQVINGKSIITGYLRNAYLQFDNGKWTVRGGLFGSEQIAMADKFWSYRYITKPVIDYSGMIFPVDLGVIAKYQPAKFITLDAALVNGRGFKDITPDSTLRVMTGITVNPSEKLMLRAFYDVMGPSGERQSTLSFTGAYIGKTLTLGAEYLAQLNHLMEEGEDYSGFSIFSAVRFAEKFSVFARYDILRSVTLEGEDDPWNLSKDGTNLYFGFDYSPARNIRISPNFNGFFPADREADFSGAVGLNVEARF